MFRFVFCVGEDEDEHVLLFPCSFVFCCSKAVSSVVVFYVFGFFFLRLLLSPRKINTHHHNFRYSTLCLAVAAVFEKRLLYLIFSFLLCGPKVFGLSTSILSQEVENMDEQKGVTQRCHECNRRNKGCTDTVR